MSLDPTKTRHARADARVDRIARWAVLGLAGVAAAGCAKEAEPTPVAGGQKRTYEHRETDVFGGDTGAAPTRVTVTAPPPTSRASGEAELSRPTQAPAEPLPVKVGGLPLVYMIEQVGPVRVVEVESGRVVAQGVAVRAPAPLSVRPDGVSIGRDTIGRGPLDPKRRYAVYVGGDRPDLLRTERITPAAPSQGANPSQVR
jgi:hypothetical protein